MLQQEHVIEISVEETNKLRESLGLAPLRVNHNNRSKSSQEDLKQQNHAMRIHSTTTSVIPPPSYEEGGGATADEVSLSISETNHLRKSLGLPPLRENRSSDRERGKDCNSDDKIGRTSSLAIHKPASNAHQESIVQQRLERSKLEREIQEGIRKLKQEEGVGLEKDGNETKSMDNLSWADLMRKKQNVALGTATAKQIPSDPSDHGKIVYKDDDMEKQNLIVSHNISDFQDGTSAILTLKDQTIGGSNHDDDDEAYMNLLENIDMTEQQVLTHNLKQKRLVQLGMGHAGGYAGYDDDEFMELGGNIQGLKNSSHRGVWIGGGEDDTKVQGFQIFGKKTQLMDSKGQGKKTHSSDLFASLEGKEVSLESSALATGSSLQQDFMTEEEEQALGMNLMVSSEKLERKRKRKEKKKSLKEYRNEGIDDSSQMIQQQQLDSKENHSSSLLEQLLASSKNRNGKKRARRMRRTDVGSDDSAEEEQLDQSKTPAALQTNVDVPNDERDMSDASALDKKKEKYFSAVEKGNQRSRAVFGDKVSVDKSTIHPVATDESIEIVEDDAFLNAAISKARRLKRLRELHANNNRLPSAVESGGIQVKGANAVVEALQKLKKKNSDENSWVHNADSTGNVTFEVGTTKEFTQALRSQSIIAEDNSNQVDTEQNIAGNKTAQDNEKKQGSIHDVSVQDDDVQMDDTKDQVMEMDDSTILEELARQVEEETPSTKGDVLDSTGTASGVGRGLSNFLGMLKKTGEISNNGKLAEELRGRAKDEKTYDDYAPLDLKKVVKIDDGIASKGGPYDRDIELANREVKLEYRDEHGRLLTRKEAYRQLCYQFHGHGSSKKKQEKRLQQIERERAEHSTLSTTDVGTLGALKATQKATGKAFVLHKI